MASQAVTSCVLEPLDLTDVDHIEEWLERFDLFATTNKDVTTKNIVPHFLVMIGANPYSVLRDLCQPNKPADLDLPRLKALLLQHCKPRSYNIMERAVFNSMVRHSDQPIRQFIQALQRQASKCDFGSLLEEHLRDRLVTGVNHPEIKRRLLLTENLTYNKAKEICDAYVSATSAATPKPTATEPEGESNVSVMALHDNQYTARGSKKPPQAGSGVRRGASCASCGGAHPRSECLFRQAECHNCHQIGHIQRVCHSAKTAMASEEHWDEEAEEALAVLMTVPTTPDHIALAECCGPGRRPSCEEGGM